MRNKLEQQKQKNEFQLQPHSFFPGMNREKEVMEAWKHGIIWNAFMWETTNEWKGTKRNGWRKGTGTIFFVSFVLFLQFGFSPSFVTDSNGLNRFFHSFRFVVVVVDKKYMDTKK